MASCHHMQFEINVVTCWTLLLLTIPLMMLDEDTSGPNGAGLMWRLAMHALVQRACAFMFHFLAWASRVHQAGVAGYALWSEATDLWLWKGKPLLHAEAKSYDEILWQGTVESSEHCKWCNIWAPQEDKVSTYVFNGKIRTSIGGWS